MENSRDFIVVILQEGQKIQHKTSYSVGASLQGNFTLKVWGRMQQQEEEEEIEFKAYNLLLLCLRSYQVLISTNNFQRVYWPCYLLFFQ